MRCPTCEADVPEKATECPECGERIKRHRGGDDEDGIVKKMIPYKNLSALIGYYLGVVALIPYVALLVGPLAIVLGIVGLIYGSKYPKAKAPGHSITAIVLSLVGLVGTVVMIYLVKNDYLESPLKLLKGGK